LIARVLRVLVILAFTVAYSFITESGLITVSFTTTCFEFLLYRAWVTVASYIEIIKTHFYYLVGTDIKLFASAVE